MIAVAIVAFIVGAMVPIIALEIRIMQLGGDPVAWRVIILGARGCKDPKMRAAIEEGAQRLGISPRRMMRLAVFADACDRQADWAKYQLEGLKGE